MLQVGKLGKALRSLFIAIEKHLAPQELDTPLAEELAKAGGHSCASSTTLVADRPTRAIDLQAFKH